MGCPHVTFICYRLTFFPSSFTVADDLLLVCLYLPVEQELHESRNLLLLQTVPLGPEPISGHLKKQLNKQVDQVSTVSESSSHKKRNSVLTSLLWNLKSISWVLINKNLLEVSVPHSIIALLLKMPSPPPFFSCLT